MEVVKVSWWLSLVVRVRGLCVFAHALVTTQRAARQPLDVKGNGSSIVHGALDRGKEKKKKNKATPLLPRIPPTRPGRWMEKGAVS